MNTTRVLVTGDRNWPCRLGVDRILARLRGRYGDGLVIVHGDCPSGVDAAFAVACRVAGIRQEPHPADWDRHGKAAGPIRNREMAESHPEFCIAFHRCLARSRGTRDCVGHCIKAGIPVYLLDAEDAEPRRLRDLAPSGLMF